MTLFKNQTSETTKCNKLINIILKLKESEKAEYATSTNEYGDDTIGIRLNGSASWYWFELRFNYDFLYFTNRYSVTTGKSDRGILSKIKFLRKIGYYND